MSKLRDRQEIAAKLKEMRIKAGYTQKSIGDLTGKASQTVASWENGKGQPDIYTFIYLCHIYGVCDIFKEFGYVFKGDNDAQLKIISSDVEKYKISENGLTDEEKLMLVLMRQMTPSERKMANALIQTVLYNKYDNDDNEIDK